MKNKALIVAGIMVCLLAAMGMTACGSTDTATEETTTVAEETTTAAETTAAATTAAPAEGDVIGEDKALEIALQDAGLSASECDYTNSHLDFDDGVQMYDVNFRKGTMEYDYDIEAATGKILAKESEDERMD